MRYGKNKLYLVLVQMANKALFHLFFSLHNKNSLHLTHQNSHLVLSLQLSQVQALHPIKTESTFLPVVSHAAEETRTDDPHYTPCPFHPKSAN